MRLSNEDIEVLNKIRTLLIQASNSGICVKTLEEDVFPNDNAQDRKLGKYIHIMKELNLVTIQNSKYCGIEYYVNEKLQHNSIQSIADKLHKEEDQKDLEIEKSKKENAMLDFQLRDYEATKRKANLSLIISIVSAITAIVAIIIGK